MDVVRRGLLFNRVYKTNSKDAYSESMHPFLFLPKDLNERKVMAKATLFTFFTHFFWQRSCFNGKPTPNACPAVCTYVI